MNGSENFNGQADDEGSLSSGLLSEDDDEKCVEYHMNPVRTFHRIREDDPELEYLYLLPNQCPSLSANFNLREWAEIGHGIGSNTHMRRLHVSMEVIDEDEDDADMIASKESLETFLAGLCKNRSLTHLHFEFFDFQRARVDIINPLLVENAFLTHIQFTSCNLGVDEIRMLSAALRRRTSGIKSIELSPWDLDYETVRHIIDLCNGCTQLKKLNLRGIKFGNRGCRDIASLLENSHSKLIHLKLHAAYAFGSDPSIDDEGVLYFLNALSNNNTLRCLELDGGSMTDNRWDPVSTLLCNSSSINATIHSNHTLECLWEKNFTFGQEMVSQMLSDDALFSLKANEEKDKTKAVRKKIFHFHLKGNFDLEPFIGMDAKILPTLISWIGKGYNQKDPDNDQSRGSAFYHILRSFPELCSYPSLERKLRLQIEVENAALKSGNAKQKEIIEQLLSEIEELKSSKRQKCGS